MENANQFFTHVIIKECPMNNQHIAMTKENIVEAENGMVMGTVFPSALNISKTKTETGFKIQIYLTSDVLSNYVYVKAIDELLSATEDDEIDIIIQTPGGDVFGGIGIASAMHRTRAKLKVVANGLCASCGSLILLEAPPECIEIREWAEIMIHGPTQMIKGKSLDIENTIVSILEWFDDRYRFYLDMGYMTKVEYENVMFKKLNVFISAPEMKKRIEKAILKTKRNGIIKK